MWFIFYPKNHINTAANGSNFYSHLVSRTCGILIHHKFVECSFALIPDHELNNCPSLSQLPILGRNTDDSISRTHNSSRFNSALQQSQIHVPKYVAYNMHKRKNEEVCNTTNVNHVPQSTIRWNLGQSLERPRVYRLSAHWYVPCTHLRNNYLLHTYHVSSSVELPRYCASTNSYGTLVGCERPIATAMNAPAPLYGGISASSVQASIRA